MQLAYRAQRLLWQLLRPRSNGVKVMLFNSAGEVLLIHNSYSDTHSWPFPGAAVYSAPLLLPAEVENLRGMARRRMMP